jgi:hypothetical protein
MLMLLQTCGDDNDSCLCGNDTATVIQACEQCMFSELIAENQRMPDPRAGSTPGLAGNFFFFHLMIPFEIPLQLMQPLVWPRSILQFPVPWSL